MEKYKIVRGTSEEEVWDQIRKDMREVSYPLVYAANIQEEDSSVFLNIEADLGGGFESGFEGTNFTAPVSIQFTTFSSRLNEPENFRFALHDEDFIDKLGKFFGMEDVKTGYAEFDKKLVVKTNDIEKVKAVFTDEHTRKVFQSLGGFNLHIAHYDHDDKHSALELSIDRDITNAEELHRIYDVFVQVLDAFEYSRHPVA